MPLLDDLRKLHLPPSHLPSINEISGLLGKLIAYAEHGQDLLEAADKDAKAIDAGEPATPAHVDQLLSPAPEEPPPAAAPAPAGVGQPAAVPASASPEVAASSDPRDAEIAALQQQLATAQAQLRRTDATVEPVSPADVPPEPPAAGV